MFSLDSEVLDRQSLGLDLHLQMYQNGAVFGRRKHQVYMCTGPKFQPIIQKIAIFSFVVQYLEMNFGTLNENTIWHQSCASAEIWHSECSLRMRIHIKPLKCKCDERNDLNLNSNHGNLKKTTTFFR